MPTVAERSEIATLANEVVEHLRYVRKQLAAEVRAYPTPITRCDAQFNDLYERQARLAHELDRIGDVEKAGRTRRIEAIERFIASAPYSDEAAEREFRARVRTEFAALRK